MSSGADADDSVPSQSLAATVLQSAEVDELGASTVRAKFSGVRRTYVNALRRIILSEIPYIGTYRNESRTATSVGGFVVRHNSGRLHDDILVDRLALIPIHLTVAEVLNFIPGSITVQLTVKNEGKVSKNITSADLQVFLFGKPHPKGSACYPPDALSGDHILITRLYPGEALDVIMTLEKSTPSVHAAFAVASLAALAPSLDDAAYKQRLDAINSDSSLDSAAKARALNHVQYIERERLILQGPDGEPVSMTLTVESASGWKGHQIIEAALEELMHKFTTSNIAYEAKVEGASLLFAISGQSHTFASVFQDICMRDRERLKIKAIGYYVVHPLEERVIMRVEMPGGPAEAEAVVPDDLFAKLRVHCAGELKKAFVNSE